MRPTLAALLLALVSACGGEVPADDHPGALDVEIPEGAVATASLEMETSPGGSLLLVLPVPRPDAYDVWAFSRGPHGQLQEPVLFATVAALAGNDLVVRVPANEPLPLALKPIPRRRWALEWNVVGPFPNPQRVGSEHSTALDSVYGPEPLHTGPDGRSRPAGGRLESGPSQGGGSGR